jgi:hypothetical protein
MATFRITCSALLLPTAPESSAADPDAADRRAAAGGRGLHEHLHQAPFRLDGEIASAKLQPQLRVLRLPAHAEAARAVQGLSGRSSLGWSSTCASKRGRSGCGGSGASASSGRRRTPSGSLAESGRAGVQVRVLQEAEDAQGRIAQPPLLRFPETGGRSTSRT